MERPDRWWRSQPRWLKWFVFSFLLTLLYFAWVEELWDEPFGAVVIALMWGGLIAAAIWGSDLLKARMRKSRGRRPGGGRRR